jgi:YebC/PmpR family DNA-binding regulatory protein
MSGHSHYSTIKRQKEANDSQKGKVFSKMAREIAIAVKTGGGTDPGFNFKLRMVIDKARSYSMPKTNIERAIAAGSGGGALDEVTYEGFGPAGISVLVQVATDNRNRTAQEFKNIFERVGGNLGGPGSVSFNFANKGFMLLEKKDDPETQMLSLIDLGVDDVEETGDGIEVYTHPEKLMETKKVLEEKGFVVKEAELYMKPLNYQVITDPEVAKKVLSFLDTLDDLDDVQKVYSNVDIPESLIQDLN